MSRALLTMTASFMACTRCRQTEEHRAVLTEDWQPPRGWAGSLSGGEARALLFVSNNPGHPLDDGSEVAFWRDDLGIVDASGHGPTRAITEEDAGRMLAFCSRAYLEPGTSGDFTFHRKASGYARAGLWLLGLDHSPRGWLDSCWFTDAFKCSTRVENGPPITPEMYATCRKHLEMEVQTLKPVAVVALGGKAYEQASQLRTGVPVLKFRHTSNGCPQLHSRAHDESFKALAIAAGKDPDLAISTEFVAFRQSLQRELFPGGRLHAREH